MGADSGILPFHSELQTLVLASLGLPGGLGYGYLGLLWLRIIDISPAPPVSTLPTYYNTTPASTGRRLKVAGPPPGVVTGPASIQQVNVTLVAVNDPSLGLLLTQASSASVISHSMT